MEVNWKFCPECARSLIPEEIEGFQRLVCSSKSCTFVHYGNPVPVVAALVEHKKGIVLVRAAHWPETWFGLVTGFLERDEAPDKAIVREVYEELNVKAKIVSLIGLYTFRRNNQIIMAYHVTIDDEPVLGEELAEYKYVASADLKPWPFGTGKAVADWLRNKNKRG